MATWVEKIEFNAATVRKGGIMCINSFRKNPVQFGSGNAAGVLLHYFIDSCNDFPGSLPGFCRNKKNRSIGEVFESIPDFINIDTKG